MENKIKKLNLLIGCTGSVATIRIVEIVNAFKEKYNIKIILTERAKLFTDPLLDYKSFEEENNVTFYFDKDEIEEWLERQKVLHIEVL